MITELPSKVQRQELKQRLLWCVERITNVQGEIKCIFRAERRLVRHKISDGRGRQYSEIWIKYQNHFLQFWTLWRTWIEIAHQKVGTAASASKPSTTKRKEKKKKEDFNGLKRRRRRDFYRRRQKIHHRTDPHASREGGREEETQDRSEIISIWGWKRRFPRLCCKYWMKGQQNLIKLPKNERLCL